MMYEIWYSIFAGIGLFVVVYYMLKIAYEILYLLLYASGYTILTLLNVNWSKAKKTPIKFSFAILKIYKEGLLECLSFFPATNITQGNWVWKPLFNFKKIKRN